MSGVDAHALQAGVLADHAPEVVEPGRVRSSGNTRSSLRLRWEHMHGDRAVLPDSKFCAALPVLCAVCSHRIGHRLRKIRIMSTGTASGIAADGIGDRC